MFLGAPTGIIAMSGSALSHWAIDNNPVETSKQIAQYQGCPTTDTLTMVKCLQNIPAASIIKVIIYFTC